MYTQQSLMIKYLRNGKIFLTNCRRNGLKCFESLSKIVSDRRVPYSIPSDWKTLWFSNLDEFQRVNDANDNNTVSNATVQLGGTAFLHCKVRNLADRTVSDAEVSCLRALPSSLTKRTETVLYRRCVTLARNWSTISYLFHRYPGYDDVTSTSSPAPRSRTRTTSGFKFCILRARTTGLFRSSMFKTGTTGPTSVR